MTKTPIPVVPAAHYSCGGVWTDAHGQTDIAGLYAAGEVAMSGFQGANRLASNSLLEGLVFARRAVEHARTVAPVAMGRFEMEHTGDAVAHDAPEERRQVLRRLMWDEVGIVRSDRGLQRACEETERMAREIEALYREHRLDAELVQLRSLETVAHAHCPLGAATPRKPWRPLQLRPSRARRCPLAAADAVGEGSSWRRGQGGVKNILAPPLPFGRS